MDDQAEMAAFIEARHFGTLVVAGPNGPQAAHIPMILNRDADGAAVSLEGHVARNNPLAAIAAQPVRALAIFNGADAYVTPSLYLVEARARESRADLELHRRACERAKSTAFSDAARCATR